MSLLGAGLDSKSQKVQGAWDYVSQDVSRTKRLRFTAFVQWGNTSITPKKVTKLILEVEDPQVFVQKTSIPKDESPLLQSAEPTSTHIVRPQHQTVIAKDWSRHLCRWIKWRLMLTRIFVFTGKIKASENLELSYFSRNSKTVSPGKPYKKV